MVAGSGWMGWRVEKHDMLAGAGTWLRFATEFGAGERLCG